MSQGVALPAAPKRRGRRPASASPVGPGTDVGSYGVEARLGAGGFGTVFRARRGGQAYALKLLALLREEVGAKQLKRTSRGITIAHFPAVKTLEDFDFKAQPSIEPRLVRELATGRFIAQAENVLLFGTPGVGKTHLAIALGRAAVETGHSVLFTNATALLAALAKAESEGTLRDMPCWAVFTETALDRVGSLSPEAPSGGLDSRRRPPDKPDYARR
ncbi:ATP-binding protein [Hyalangium gracile]|uniref:ATP-binding protein n=1 Tax=Hyalangium gracile TaxID=394092 RepID=UPI00295E8A57|nr:ATP-binding protein [Hyalangium gracile]